MMCPQCEEEAHATEPSSWITPLGGTPAYSHLDGTGLCPEMTTEGYRPAQPVPATSD